MSNDETDRTSMVFRIFLVLVFSLGFMKPAVDVGFAPLTPTDLIFPILFLIWIGSIARGYETFRWRSQFWVLVFYLLAFAISAAFSDDLQRSLRKLPGELYLILLAIVATSLVTTTERLRVTILAWIAGCVPALVTALAAILVFYLDPQSPWLASLTYHYGAVPVGHFPRVSSTFVSASMFCNYLTVTLVLVLLSARMRWIATTSAVILIGSIGVAAIFTVSIALGGFFLASGMWIWISSSNRIAAKSALVFSCVIAFAFLAIAPFSLKSQPVFSVAVPSSRALVWQEAATTFLADPITGRGIGTAVANVTFQNSDGTWSLLTDAHNTFLSVAAQSGVIALAAIIGIVLVVLRSVRLRAREEDYLIRAGLAAAFVAAFVYEGMTSSFEDARHLWVLMGLIFAAGKMRASASLDGA